jgi:hypothetical protein
VREVAARRSPRRLELLRRALALEAGAAPPCARRGRMAPWALEVLRRGRTAPRARETTREGAKGLEGAGRVQLRRCGARVAREGKGRARERRGGKGRALPSVKSGRKRKLGLDADKNIVYICMDLGELGQMFNLTGRYRAASVHRVVPGPCRVPVWRPRHGLIPRPVPAWAQ